MTGRLAPIMMVAGLAAALALLCLQAYRSGYAVGHDIAAREATARSDGD